MLESLLLFSDLCLGGPVESWICVTAGTSLKNEAVTLFGADGLHHLRGASYLFSSAHDFSSSFPVTIAFPSGKGKLTWRWAVRWNWFKWYLAKGWGLHREWIFLCLAPMHVRIWNCDYFHLWFLQLQHTQHCYSSPKECFGSFDEFPVRLWVPDALLGAENFIVWIINEGP